MACGIKPCRWPWVGFKVISLLQTFQMQFIEGLWVTTQQLTSPVVCLLTSFFCSELKIEVDQRLPDLCVINPFESGVDNVYFSMAAVYVIGQVICIFILSFVLLSFFPRLISAVADWMSAILHTMVWPYCEFRMQVWNVLHAARWKYRTQKLAKKSPSGHHRTTLSGYIFANKACIDNRKKNC